MRRGVAVLVADLFEFLDDDAAELLLAGKDGFELGDVVADGAELVEELVDGELGEAVQLQFKDGVDLAVAEDERAGVVGGVGGGRDADAVGGELGGDAAAEEIDRVLGGVEGDAGDLCAAEVDTTAGEEGEEVFAGVGAGGGLADDADDLIEVVKGDLVAEEGVFTLAGAVEEEGGATADDLDAVIEEGVDGVVEGEFLRLAVVDGEEDHREGLLQLGMLEELIEDDLVLGAAFEFDDDAHAVAVGLIADVGDLVDDLVGDELGDALDEGGLVDLVGDLGDDDGLAATGDGLDGALGAHHEAAAAGAVGLLDVGAAVEVAAGREVRAFHVLEDELEIGAGV